jgi:hypothetical protein
MESLKSPEFPPEMNAFATTEHFTLQSARGLINAELMNRVSLYFTTVSSLLIATAFLAQSPGLADLFGIFVWVAFPVVLLLGVFTLARLMTLARMDSIYIRAINRIRQFYVQAAPEMERFILFPPHDDERSTRVFGGYSLGFRGNLLSAASAVSVTNSIIATVIVSALLNSFFGMKGLALVPFGVALFVIFYVLQGLLGQFLARRDHVPEYGEVRFPPPSPDPKIESPHPK